MTAYYDSASRYRLDAAGQTASRIAVNVQNYTVYTVREADTLESVAFRHYGNPKRYWEIADANPQIQFPLDIKTGDVLRLPR